MDLPFVDQQVRVVAASPERTWTALEEYVDRLTTDSHPVLSPVLGAVPRSGFQVLTTEPRREIVLGGRHRFSTYRLVFRVDPEGPDSEASRLRALTYAAFPGMHGRAYRAGLMLTTGHARATRGMLRTVARRAEADGR